MYKIDKWDESRTLRSMRLLQPTVEKKNLSLSLVLLKMNQIVSLVKRIRFHT